MEYNSFLYKISNWIINYLKKYFIISELYLIGSAIEKDYEIINDVDIIQKLNECNKTDLLKYSTILIQLKTDFQAVFKKSLHITTFTSNEYDTFDIFLNKNKNIKLI